MLTRIKLTKRRIVYSIIGLVVLIQVLPPVWLWQSNPAVQSEPQWHDPQSRSLAQRACFDCHSNQTEWPWYSNVAPLS